jgi:hypothetical protein
MLLREMQNAIDPAKCEGAATDRDGRARGPRTMLGGGRSVRNAQCPDLRRADRGIYAGNRVCVRGWRDYVMTFPTPWGAYSSIR